MGLMTNLRITLRLLADRIGRFLDLRDWFNYRRWLKSCRTLTVKNVKEIYESLHADIPAASAEKMLQGSRRFFRVAWRSFPPSAVEELEQLFQLYRLYERELERTSWKKPDPRSELFQRFWRENRR